MGAITFRTINDAIETALSAATGLAKSESYDELTDGVMDYPLLQVYYQSHTVDPTGPTDRSAFGGAVRVWEILYHADLYAAQRGDLAENMDAVMTMVDEIDQE
ncbi:MAG: hypothetical protein KKD44_29050, partial [Proteobacteria bacterium]|nr:hypothetical protein [Pseudomonadota bacterium]